MDTVFILVGFIFELHVRALLAWLTLLSSIPLVSTHASTSQARVRERRVLYMLYASYQVLEQFVLFIADAAHVSYSPYLPAASRRDSLAHHSEGDYRMPGGMEISARSSLHNSLGLTSTPATRTRPVHVHGHTLSGPIDTRSILAKYPKEWHKSLERIYVEHSGRNPFGFTPPQASSRVHPCVPETPSPCSNLISELDQDGASSHGSFSSPCSPRERATPIERAQMWSFRFPTASPSVFSPAATSQPRTPFQHEHAAANGTFGCGDQSGDLQLNHVVDASPLGDTVQHEQCQLTSMDSDVFNPDEYEDEASGDIDLSQYSAESLDDFYHDADLADSCVSLTLVSGASPRDSSSVKPEASISSSGSSRSSGEHVAPSFSLDDTACVGNFKSLMQSIASMEPVSAPAE
ncbi:hypothetical protein CONPUDRAFT_145806 [Coniophora puteana RWD-64-598 SS2]|uniref:Uncharacterized protein n=1 Tax=Coniophora puteana (strain RWD-64-598) TaxID=741705 RepID=A0A5M3MIC2_CONPW|nr:uncharacterized protein CONPUDRAFT_145806 [Coniophora puteana RWD-64-598 SS2]EIW78670.1 hypothetical protein CONPUDRAFT_145806 [Coniophora puteana RWD-64-598 SS2]